MSLLTLTIRDIHGVKKGIIHIQFCLMPLQTGLNRVTYKIVMWKSTWEKKFKKKWNVFMLCTWRIKPVILLGI